MLTPAIYRTTVTHNRQTPVQHAFQYRSYSWYVDLDELPSLPWWLRPFARFDARDHLAGRPGRSLRERVDAYLLPPANTPVLVSKRLYVSPFNPVAGHYQVLAPPPDGQVDVVVSLHGDGQPAFVATLRGHRRPATVGHVARMQILSPLAPLVVALRIRIQGIALWLRRVPVVPRIAVTGEDDLATINPERWPSVVKVPSGPAAVASGAVANRLLRRAAARLPLRLVYPDGTVIGAGNTTSPTLRIRRPDRLARRIGRHGLIGFGESYMAGEWESDALTEVLTVLATGVADLIPKRLHWLRPIVLASRPYSAPSRQQARRDVAAHYDLSNDLFAEFLDQTMTYSSAWFTKLPASWPDLAEAQRRKIDRLLDAADVGPGTRLLEIGTGWGELAIRAARRGAHVRSVTLSERQVWMARQRISAAGLSDRIQVDLRDYRDVGGNYDAVISVEMLEAIGFQAWPVYFRTLEQLLKPNGRLAVQAITMPHNRMMATRNTHTWIQKYIFPGGLVPSAKAILDITERETALRAVDMFSLQEHYAETLRLWRERFMQRRKTLAHIGFDEVFARMWELYLAHAEAGFRSGYLNVYQWTFVSEATP